MKQSSHMEQLFRCVLLVIVAGKRQLTTKVWPKLPTDEQGRVLKLSKILTAIGLMHFTRDYILCSTKMVETNCSLTEMIS